MPAPPPLEVVEFALDATRYAVPAARVVEVAPRVLVTPLPGVEPPVLGVIVCRGAPVPAVDLRARLGHPPRAPARDDHLVIARGARRLVALLVDRVHDLRQLARDDVRPAPVPAPHVAGVVAQADGVLLIEDLDAALSLDEERAIDAGLLARDAGT